MVTSLSAIPTLDDEDTPRTPRGIQSVEVGGQLLKVLARTGRRMALKDLARAADMTAAKAHPYLVSFGKLGLIEQDAVSGHYGLGPLAMQLGLISLQQVDPVRLAIAELPALAQRIGYTVSASVWGDSGPVIIRVEEGPTAVYVAMRHGTTASVRHTATGKVFAAFGPRERAAAALAHRSRIAIEPSSRICALQSPSGLARSYGSAMRLGRSSLLPGLLVLLVGCSGDTFTPVQGGENGGSSGAGGAAAHRALVRGRPLLQRVGARPARPALAQRTRRRRVGLDRQTGDSRRVAQHHQACHSLV